MGSGSQINGALKLIGRRNYCDECVMVRRRWRPVWIRVSTPQRQTQTALCVLIYPEKPLQPLGLASSWPPPPLAAVLTGSGTVIRLDLYGPQAQTLKWALLSGDWGAAVSQSPGPSESDYESMLLIDALLIGFKYTMLLVWKWNWNVKPSVCHWDDNVIQKF